MRPWQIPTPLASWPQISKKKSSYVCRQRRGRCLVGSRHSSHVWPGRCLPLAVSCIPTHKTETVQQNIELLKWAGCARSDGASAVETPSAGDLMPAVSSAAFRDLERRLSWAALPRKSFYYSPSKHPAWLFFFGRRGSLCSHPLCFLGGNLRTCWGSSPFTHTPGDPWRRNRPCAQAEATDGNLIHSHVSCRLNPLAARWTMWGKCHYRPPQLHLDGNNSRKSNWLRAVNILQAWF